MRSAGICSVEKTEQKFRRIRACLKENKTRTSKVGAISKPQKAQNIFLGKNLKFLKYFFFRKMSHSAEKCNRGTLLDLLTYILLQNIKKLEGGTEFLRGDFKGKTLKPLKKVPKSGKLISFVERCRGTEK